MSYVLLKLKATFWYDEMILVFWVSRKASNKDIFLSELNYVGSVLNTYHKISLSIKKKFFESKNIPK